MARVLVLGSFADSLILFRGRLLAEMVRHGHEVYACAPEASRQIRHALSDMGVTYCDIKLQRTGMNPVKDMQSLLGLVRLYKRIQPDVFLGYTIKPVLYGSLAAKIAAVPGRYSMIEGLGFTFMGTGFKSRMLGMITRRLYRLALRFNSKVFFLNPDNLEVFTDQGLLHDEQQAVMLNGIGVDLEHFSPAPFPEQLSFLLIARLLKDKGVREYAEAARRVRKKYPQIPFRLVGWLDQDNPNTISKEDLESWVAADDIEYIGRLSDVRPAIQESSVYVLPSYHEGTPVSVLESMSMGRPIVTTDAPGCRETVRHGENGLMVPVADVRALVEALEHFIRHPDDIQKFGQASRRIAEEKYDVHKVNRIMMQAMGLVE